MTMAGAIALIESVEVMIKQPGHADRVVRLSEGATRMGRAEDNEIVLSDVGVSRRHAQVYVSRGEVTVEDLGSGNGTYYNGYRIQSQPVQDGDEIVIDPFVLHFKVRGQERAGRGDENRASTAPARLQVVVGSGMAGSSYPITSRGLSIGRSEDRDVVIADPAASRHHCQINLQGGEYVLRDMGSANGVFVNAVRVRECTLADGDLVRIGNTEMRFVRFEGSGADAAGHAAGPGSQASDHQGAGMEAHGSRQRQGQWNEMPSPSDGYAPEPTQERRRSSTPIFAVLFGGLIVFVGFMTVLLAVFVAVVFVLRNQMGAQIRPTEATPPRWALTLPTGLEPAPVDALFDQGQNKMRDRNHREALQDFYRVLQADPAHPSVDKFAFAAGEYLVVDTLEKELNRQATERAKREAERNGLLADLKEGSRDRQIKAAQKLKTRFRDDPAAMAALDMEPSKTLLELSKLSSAGSENMANGRYDDASKLFQDVLDGSRDPEARNQALANLKVSQKEVARASAEKWQRAVMAEATADKATAKVLLLELKEEHPANPSVPVHLSRLP